MTFAYRQLPAVLLLGLTCGLALSSRGAAADDPSPEVKALVAKLREDMKSKSVPTRVAAYKAMGELGEKAKWQRRALCEGMLDSNIKVRTTAADALKSVDEPIYKLATGILINKDAGDIAEAGKLKEHAEPLAPIILAYATSLVPTASLEPGNFANLQARASMTRCVVALAATAPEDEGVNKAIIAMLGNQSPTLRALALDHVAPLKNKKQALKGVVAIASATKDASRVRAQAVRLLPSLVDENTGPATKKAIEALRFDTDEAVREAVAKALTELK